MGVKAPKSACAYALVNGKYEKICDFTNITSSDATAYWISASFNAVKTDKIKFEFTLDGAFMYLNEVEVHGKVSEGGDAMLGDVNGDGEIDKYDYIAVKRAVMGTLTLTDAQKKAADVNGKDGIEKFDYILIKRHVMGTYKIA